MRRVESVGCVPGCGQGLGRLTVSLPVSPMSEVTRILSAIEQGDPHAAGELLPLVYDELRKLAAQKLAQEKPGQTRATHCRSQRSRP